MRYFKATSILLLLLLFMGLGKKEVELREGTLPGNLAPTTDLQGIEFENNEFVLVQFWASANPDSRVDNVLMHNLISDLGEEKVKLVSISLDESEALFKGAVEADRLDKSTQYHCPEATGKVIFKRHKLNAESGNWLIDSDGVIVAVNLNPEEIKKIL